MGSTYFTFFQKSLIQKVGFLGGARGPNSAPKIFCPKMFSKSIDLHERIFLIGDAAKKLLPLKVAHVRVLISHWSRNLAEIFLQFLNCQPFSFLKWYDT